MESRYPARPIQAAKLGNPSSPIQPRMTKGPPAAEDGVNIISTMLMPRTNCWFSTQRAWSRVGAGLLPAKLSVKARGRPQLWAAEEGYLGKSGILSGQI